MDTLLDGVEVEWTLIGDKRFVEIANSNRKPVKASLRKLGKTPYFGANNIQDYVEGYTHDGVFILIAEDGSASLENYSIQWATGQFWANNHVHVLRSTGGLDNRFLYHYLKNVSFIPFLSGGARAKLTKSKLVEIPIPIPPLRVQEEIVRILDTFTELTAELTAELAARKKQYNYYREQLLTFGDDVPMAKLGEIAIKTYSGATPLANKFEYYNDGTIPWLRTQEVRFADIISTDIKITPYALSNTAVKWVPENCVIIAISGATAGRSAINKIPLTTNQHCLCLEIDDKKAMYRYVFHWVCNKYEDLKSLGQGARLDLNSTIIKKYPIPLPPLEEQERIVNILDKFDTLTTSITEGLPREIELRQKQYEYYRNMLLSFPKEEV